MVGLACVVVSVTCRILRERKVKVQTASCRVVACGVIADTARVAASDFHQFPPRHQPAHHSPHSDLRVQTTETRQIDLSVTMYALGGIRGVPRWDRRIGWLIITPSVGEGVLIIIYILTIYVPVHAHVQLQLMCLVNMYM